jgi:hypothetical protein
VILEVKRPSRHPGAWRRLLAVPVAVVALILATSPVAATEIWRSHAYLYDQAETTWYGEATLDRWFGGSPVHSIKTTLKLDMADLKSARWYKAKVIAGDCWSEGYTLASISVKSGASGKILRTLGLTSAQRQAVQRAYDRGWPVSAMFVGNGLELCGALE